MNIGTNFSVGRQGDEISKSKMLYFLFEKLIAVLNMQQHEKLAWKIWYKLVYRFREPITFSAEIGLTLDDRQIFFLL